MVYDPLPFVEQLSELSQVDEVLFHPGTVRYPGVVLDRIHKMAPGRLCPDAFGESRGA